MLPRQLADHGIFGVKRIDPETCRLAQHRTGRIGEAALIGRSGRCDPFGSDKEAVALQAVANARDADGRKNLAIGDFLTHWTLPASDRDLRRAGKD